MSALDRHFSIDSMDQIEQCALAVPAKRCVFLFEDVAGNPIQLMTSANCRQSFRNRMIASEPTERSKRIDYRAVVRRIRWREVHSHFESDLVYLIAARECFPQSYRELLRFEPADFIHIDPDSEHPRYTRTTDLRQRCGNLYGPVPGKDVAARLIEDLNDWFDLCRYHHILIQSPNGVACAYKDMGKCPAPCDGSVSMEQYRQLVELSVNALREPDEYIRQQTVRMHAAANELRFEAAAKVKTYVDSLGQLGTGPLRYVRPFNKFSFISFQRGRKQGSAKVYLVMPDSVEELVAVPTFASDDCAELLGIISRRISVAPTLVVADLATDFVGLVSHYLFHIRRNAGEFLPLDQVSEASIRKALSIVRNTEPEPDSSQEIVA